MKPAARELGATFPVFFQAHYDFVHGVALRTVGRADVAEDVSQEVFARIWTRPDVYDPSRGSVRTWLRMITRSSAIERLRRDSATERRDRNHAEDHVRSVRASSADELALTVLRHDALRRAIAALPPMQRIAIELAYFDGMTYQDVARFTQTAEGTIKSRIRAGLKQLGQTVDVTWSEAIA